MPGLIKKEEFKDNCGFGLIANINGIKSHKVIINSINALISMTHRGGVGSDGKTGDGCGLLFDIDHKFFADTVLVDVPHNDLPNMDAPQTAFLCRRPAL